MGRYNIIGPQPITLTSHPIILTGLEFTKQSPIVIFQKGKKNDRSLISKDHMYNAP